MAEQTRILIVEDEAVTRDLIATLLRKEYAVTPVADAAAALAQLKGGRFDLLVLDLNLPDGDGLALARELGPRPGPAVIIVTARSDDVDRIVGLELGADDYITKPFNPRELMARIKAVLRRFERPLEPSVVNVGDITIDTGAMTLTVRGTTVPTTATEFRLLDYLARHPGRVFTRDNLLDAVWRDTAFVTPRSVDVYVRRLREKIESDPEQPIYLRTVRGAGYRFEVPK